MIQGGPKPMAITPNSGGVEYGAPGEEQVVFSTKAGVVASKTSYIDVLDANNEWRILESPVGQCCLVFVFLLLIVTFASLGVAFVERDAVSWSFCTGLSLFCFLLLLHTGVDIP